MELGAVPTGDARQNKALLRQSRPPLPSCLACPKSCNPFASNENEYENDTSIDQRKEIELRNIPFHYAKEVFDVLNGW